MLVCVFKCSPEQRLSIKNTTLQSVHFKRTSICWNNNQPLCSHKTTGPPLNLTTALGIETDQSLEKQRTEKNTLRLMLLRWERWSVMSGELYGNVSHVPLPASRHSTALSASFQSQHSPSLQISLEQTQQIHEPDR